MAFKFYLDGQLTDQPMNDKELSTTIKRNSNLGALLITQDVDLEWNGNNAFIAPAISGYNYLKGIFDNGTCAEVAVRITEDLSPTVTAIIYVGVIKVPSLRFNLQTAIVKAQIQDNSFYSYINNNKSIKYNLQSTVTKNGEAIVSPQIYGVDMFDGSNSTYLSTLTPPQLFSGYRVYDALEFLIRAMSDNKVGFYSFFLQQEPVPFIFDGFALKDYTAGPNVVSSFNQLFTELQKIYNLSFFVDYTDFDNPIVVMEPSHNLYQGLSAFQFSDIKDLEVAVNSTNLYGTVRVGADNNPSGAAPDYTMPTASFFTYNNEVFMPQGQCNIDSELDLLNTIHITNNDINYQVNGGSGDFYDDLFLVECGQVDSIGSTASAIQYAPWTSVNPAATGPVSFYNYGFTNLKKLENNGDNIQTVLTSTLSTGVGGFNAANSTEFNAGSTDPYYSGTFLGLPETALIFNNISGSGNYNAGDYDPLTGIYTAPADGQYSFAGNYKFEAFNLKACFSNFTITTAGPGLPVGSYQTIGLIDVMYVTAQIKHYDSLNNLLNTSIQQIIVTANQTNADLNLNYAANMLTGDYIVWTLESKIYKRFWVVNSLSVYPTGANFIISQPLHPDFGYGISGNPWSTWNWPFCAQSPYANLFCLITSTMSCTGQPNSGITVGVSQPGTFDEYQYTFDYEIAQSDFLAIKSRPTALFIFEKDGIERVGWIESMKRDDWTGLTQITLVTNNATTTQ